MTKTWIEKCRHCGALDNVRLNDTTEPDFTVDTLVVKYKQYYCWNCFQRFYIPYPVAP